jgi:hypothetical protein
MSVEAIAFLVLVFGGLSVFGIVLGYVSRWSGKPDKRGEIRSGSAEGVSASIARGHMA